MFRQTCSVFALLTVLFMIVITSDGIHAQTARECYERGLVLKAAGDIDGAIGMFDKARKLDRDFADANYELARCYIQINTLASRKKAGFAIDHALGLDHDNLQYLFTLSELYHRKYMHNERFRALQKILKIVPDYYDALYALADYYTFRYNDLKRRYAAQNLNDLLDPNLAGYLFSEKSAQLMLNHARMQIESIDGLEEELLISNPGIMESERRKAIEIYERLELDCPNDYTASYKKGLLYYYAHEFKEMIDVFNELVSRDSTQIDAYLFLGIGYAELGEHEKSNRNYVKAISKMSEEERALFENIDFISPEFDTESWRKTLQPQNIDNTGFWRSKDPLFLTNFNERKLAHYGRIAEAILLFSQPENELPGWKTDRGRVLIRYGRPNLETDEVVAAPLYNPMVMSPLKGEKTSKYDHLRDLSYVPFPGNNVFNYTYWRYDDFTFVFGVPKGDYSTDFELKSWRSIDFREKEIEIFEEYTDRYTYTPRGLMFAFPVDFVEFKGENGKTDVDIYYDIPLNVIQMKRLETTWQGVVVHGVFIFDKDWDLITSNVDTTALIIDSADFDSTSINLYPQCSEQHFAPGDVHIAVELVDTAQGNTGVFRAPVVVEDFHRPELQISGLLVGNLIEKQAGHLPIGRNNMSLHANPQHLFGTHQQIYLYFEIYNLYVADEFNRSRYTMEYSIQPLQPEQGLLKRVFQFIKGVREGVAVTSDITGIGRTDNRILVIDHGINKPGEYILNIKVTDKTTGQSAERTMSIRLY
ncbi:GWxTD domain-containing protein [candidate division KSB1 bacterium]